MLAAAADTSGEINVAIARAGCIARHFYGTKPSFRLLYPLPPPRMKSKFATTLGLLALGHALKIASPQSVRLYALSNIPALLIGLVLIIAGLAGHVEPTP